MSNPPMRGRRMRISLAAFALLVASVALIAASNPTRQAQQDQEAALRERRLRCLRLGLRRFGNPAALIRAANVLRKESKEDALYMICTAIASGDEVERPTSWRSPESIGRLASTLPNPIREFKSDPDKRRWTGEPVLLLVAAAFSPKDATTPPSEMHDHDEPCRLMKPISSSYPLLFIGGVPFNLSGIESWAVPDPRGSQLYGNSQVPRSRFEFIAWADAHARVDPTVLVPPDDPFELADNAVKQLSESSVVIGIIGSEGIEAAAKLIRGQSIKMLEGSLEPLLPEIVASPFDFLEIQRDLTSIWSATAAAARARHLHWDREAQVYKVDER